MTLNMNGVQIMFRAIESMQFDADKRLLVVRTVSGAIHTKPMDSPKMAGSVIDRILESMAAYESV